MPTIPELGYTPYEAESWNGVLAPAETPKDTLAQLEGWFTAAVRSPELKELGALGIYPEAVCGADYSASLRRQYEHYGSAIRDSKLKVE